MITNPFSLLAAFLAGLRVLLGLLALGTAAVALARHRRARAGDDAPARRTLLVLLCWTLVALAVVSWPLFYLVLQSYVPEWPGVMCIRGVTLIGSGSIGAAGLLPDLVRGIEVGFPLLLFSAGLAAVLLVAQCHAAAREGSGAFLGALGTCALLALLHGAAELAYLLIPKRETTLAAGCCTVRPSAAVDTVGPLPHLSSAPFDPWGGATIAFLAVSAAVALLLTLRLRGRGPAALPLLGALASIPVGLHFLHVAGAPAFLRLPAHRCVYCMIADAPEGVLGIVLFLLGAFATGWAAAVRRLGPSGGARRLERPLLAGARFGYLGSAVLVIGRFVTT